MGPRTSREDAGNMEEMQPWTVLPPKANMGQCVERDSPPFPASRILLTHPVSREPWKQQLESVSHNTEQEGKAGIKGK